MSLKKRFNDLGPKQKKIVIWAGIGAIFMVVVATGYNSSKSEKVAGLFGQKKTREIQLEPDLIQKTMLREQRRKLDTLADTVDKIEKDQKKNRQTNNSKILPEIPSADQVAAKTETPPPKEVKQPWPLPPGGSQSTSLPQHAQPEPKIIGEISVLTNQAVAAEGIDGQGKKDKKRADSLSSTFFYGGSTTYRFRRFYIRERNQ